MRLLFVLVIGLTACATPASSPAPSDDPTSRPEHETPSRGDTAAPAPTESIKSSEASAGATVGGRPIRSVTAQELVATAKAAGWHLVDGVPAELAIMTRQSKGRESTTVALQKGKIALAVMLVRPTPGQKSSADSDIIDAKTTVQSFSSEATYLDGDVGVVVSARPGMGEDPSLAAKQALLDTLVKR